jgi:hypothetical protein
MRKRYILTRLALIECALIILLTGYDTRGDGAIVHSQHFAIHNRSGATAQELQDFAATLEQAYADVTKFLEKAPPSSIWVSLEDRRAIPSARGGTLAFYRYGGRIQAEAVAHEIVHLTTGYTSSPVIEEGLAVYVAEALAPNARSLFPQIGQSVNDWVALFRQQGTFIPLERVLETISFQWNLDGSPEDTQAWQTYVEAGSMVRWIVESRGWEVFWRFYQTRSTLVALDAPVAEIEREWLQHLARQELTPKSCRDVLAQNVPRFRFWCQHVDASGSATPPSMAPLPVDVRIVPPEAAVRQQLAAFSGKWSGVWDEILSHILVVEEITPPHAIVIYAWGTAHQWQIAQPGWSRVQGEFVDGALKLSLRRPPATVMYPLQLDGMLDATYEWAGGLSRANLTRAKEEPDR